jgi:putative glycosyltransferase
MRLSIVTSMYRSERYVEAFYEAYSRCAGRITDEFELIFVDDGSPDDSAARVEDIARKDARVRLVRLSRNFGQSAAMCAGLTKARGELVFTADVDLEDSPELLPRFCDLMARNPGLQSVYAFMPKRQGGLGERLAGALFYSLLNAISRDRIQPQLWSRLMTRKFVDALLEYPEYHLFWSGLFQAVGFQQLAVPAERSKTGRTSYTFLRRFELAVDALTSFTDRPLQLIFLAGLAISLLSAGCGVWLVIRRLTGDLVSGWASIMISIWFFGGAITALIGLVGLYVGKTFVQAKHRPRFIIDRET